MSITRITALVLAAIIVLCGASAAIAQSPIVLKIGHGHSQQHPDHLGYLKFKELLEKSSNGRMKVEIYPNEQLGSEEEMAQQVKLGTLTGLVAARYEDMSPKLSRHLAPVPVRDTTTPRRC